MGLFRKKYNDGLEKTRSGLLANLKSIFSGGISDEFYEELEEILILADVGATVAADICEELKNRVKEKTIKDADVVRDEIRDIVSEMMYQDNAMKLSGNPAVILVIGVNGVGKTTTIGKLASMYASQGKKVLLAAADTFRAAAIDQLQVWADRAGIDCIRHEQGSDPAAVVFDAVTAAKSRGMDLVICDTAGRLHNKKNLMDELAKISRVIKREIGDSDVETLLVLDATTGQNAVVQAKNFKEVTDITGIILTKLDGTAKGGVVVAIRQELDVPVRFIGVGEQIDDLQPFDSDDFARALFEEDAS